MGEEERQGWMTRIGRGKERIDDLKRKRRKECKRRKGNDR